MARERGLYRRKDSPYWWIDVVLPDGVRVCESTRCRDESEATAYLISLKAAALTRRRVGIEVDHSWQEAVVRYLRENFDKASLDDDKHHLRALHPFLGELMLQAVNMDVLWTFIEHRRDVDGVKPATINRALEIVRRIGNLAHDEWGWLERPIRVRMLEEPKGRVRYLTRDEADRLLEELPPHLGPVVQYALATGWRMREILGLRWERVDFTRQVAWLEPGTTKNGEGRGSPLIRDALLALRRVQGQHPNWCFTYNGRPMGEVGDAFKRALVRAEIEEFRFHDLRHTWASWHVMAGTSLQELKELGGWKSFEMVLRYAHLGTEHLAGAARRIERPLRPVDEHPTIALR